MSQKSKAEEAFDLQVRALELPLIRREYRFAPPRRWRFDFAFVGQVAVEIQGGTWSGGRHVRGKGYEADCEKRNEATLLGWRVLYFTPRMVADGTAIATLERALEGLP